MVKVKPTFGGESFELDARLSFKKDGEGNISLVPVSYTHLVGADILFRKVAHIRERQPREGAEQELYRDLYLFGVFQFPLHQQADLIFGQETACCFLLLDFILDVYKRQRVRIAKQGSKE